MKKKIVCFVLGLVMMLSQTMTVFATSEAQLKQEKSQAENRLNDTNNKIDELSEKQTEIQAEINALDADLVDLMIQIDATKADIELTETNIQTTQENIVIKEQDIEVKKAEITKTQEELVIAEENRDQQYQDMKTRIQYMYENGGSSAWVNMIFGNGGITSLLNRVEYAQSMHEYDRDSLDKFKAIVAQIEELKATLENQKVELENQKVELENQKAELEGQKASLVSQKNDLENQEADLNYRLDQKKATSENYESQIATARSQAAEIRSLIRQQEAEIQRLAEERRAAEERARREAEERARREEAARQEAARQEAANSSNHSSNNNSNNSSNNSSNNNSNNNASSSNKDYSAPSGKSGSAIVAYADQFVGNPYVWGGNSLTNGIDCSHFVYQVLKNCGVYSGGYETSAGWRDNGRKVNSLAEAQAGDVLCYSGHVAIYDGYGGIVEAKGSKWGITHDRSATYSTILAIRRFV